MDYEDFWKRGSEPLNLLGETKLSSAADGRVYIFSRWNHERGIPAELGPA
jgi:hypothetical protein